MLKVKCLSLCFFLLLMIFFCHDFDSFTYSSSSIYSHDSLVSNTKIQFHQPIVLEYEYEFEAYSSSGNGSISNPYIISEYTISCINQSYNNIGLLVSSTDSNYRTNYSLRNIEVFGCFTGIALGYSPVSMKNVISHSNYYYGFKLDGVNAFFDNLTAYNNKIGFLASLMNSIFINSKSFQNEAEGFWFDALGSSVLNHNVAYNNFNGFRLGIYNSIVVNNTASYNQISFNFSGRTDSWSVFENNIASFSKRGFSIDYSYNLKLRNNTFSNNEYGFHSKHMLNTSLTDSIFFNNIYSGAYVDEIYFDCVLENNTFLNNVNYGLNIPRMFSNITSDTYINNSIGLNVGLGSSEYNLFISNSTFISNQLGINFQHPTATVFNNLFINNTAHYQLNPNYIQDGYPLFINNTFIDLPPYPSTTITTTNSIISSIPYSTAENSGIVSTSDANNSQSNSVNSYPITATGNISIFGILILFVTLSFFRKFHK